MISIIDKTAPESRFKFFFQFLFLQIKTGSLRQRFTSWSTLIFNENHNFQGKIRSDLRNRIKSAKKSDEKGVQ